MFVNVDGKFTSTYERMTRKPNNTYRQYVGIGDIWKETTKTYPCCQPLFSIRYKQWIRFCSQRNREQNKKEEKAPVCETKNENEQVKLVLSTNSNNTWLSRACTTTSQETWKETKSYNLFPKRVAALTPPQKNSMKIVRCLPIKTFRLLSTRSSQLREVSDYNGTPVACSGGTSGLKITILYLLYLWSFVLPINFYNKCDPFRKNKCVYFNWCIYHPSKCWDQKIN